MMDSGQPSVRAGTAPGDEYNSTAAVSASVCRPEIDWRAVPVLFAVYFILVAVPNFDAAWDGLYGDGLGYMGQATLEYSLHPLHPYVIPGEFRDSGHPLVLCYLVGLPTRWFGSMVFWAHLSVWICGALLFYQLHALVTELCLARLGRTGAHIAGGASVLLLWAHPTVAGLLAQYTYSIPESAFFLAMVRAAWRQRALQLFGWCLLLVFSRITGVAALVGLMSGLLVCDFLFRENGRRLNLRLLLPVTGAIFLFALYLGNKLILLDRPLTDFPSNQHWSFHPAPVLRNLWEMQDAVLGAIPWGMGPILLIAMGGWGCVAASRILSRRAVMSAPTARLCVIAFSAAAATLFLYAVHATNQNPRYFVFLYPFITAAFVMLGVVAPKWVRACLILLAIPWLALQISQWHPDTWRDWAGRWPVAARLPFAPTGEPLRLFSRNPERSMLANRAELSLEVRDHIRVMRDMADTLRSLPERPHVLGTFGSAYAMMRPYAGYVDRPFEGEILNVNDPDFKLEAVLDRLKSEGRNPVVVVCAWDYKFWKYLPSTGRLPPDARVSAFFSGGQWVGAIYQF